MQTEPQVLLFAGANQQAVQEFEQAFGDFYMLRTAIGAREALDILEREPIHMVITDYLLANENSSDETGVRLLEQMVRTHPKVGRMLTTPDGNMDALLDAVNHTSIHGSIVKPFQVERARGTIDEILAKVLVRRREMDRDSGPTQDPSLTELKEQLTKAQIELGSALQELKATQYQLIISEKMAALGQLVANVGHEINTPVGAIKSSATSMVKTLRPFIKELPGLMKSMEAEHAELLHELLIQASSNETSLSTREERAYRRELEERFTKLGVEDADEVARSLVEMQLVEDIDKFAMLFGLKQGKAILEMVKHVAQLRSALININMAAEKTTKIIIALKSYSYVSKDDRFEPVMLDQSIQSILTIYHNLLKHGIQVIKNYQEVPPIPAIPDQLGQVWANIIHNAIQAMKGSGTLTISIALEDPYVHVRIADSGAGIPPENINRIFEPFFTTKEHGEGSGLGLDICRRIVERHRGKIDVESKPGDTSFSVYLPLEQPAGA